MVHVHDTNRLNQKYLERRMDRGLPIEQEFSEKNTENLSTKYTYTTH